MTTSFLLDLVSNRTNRYHSDLHDLNISNKYVVVVGFGSIGKRITHLLESSGVTVHVVSRHQTSGYISFDSLEQSHLFADMIVIATETNNHLDQLYYLRDAGYKGVMYIEKPLVSSLSQLSEISSNFTQDFIDRLFCGYNFRYHLLTDIVRDFFSEYSSDVFLKYTYNENVKTWNNSVPWNKSYATSSSGGGAILTLSHAVDQLSYLLGDSLSLVRLLNMPSLLDTDANEGVVALVSALLNTNSIDGVLEIGYHAYPGKHTISLNTAEFSLDFDFKADRLCIGIPHSRTVHSVDLINLRDLSIRKSLATLLCTQSHSCTFSQAASTLNHCHSLIA